MATVQTNWEKNKFQEILDKLPSLKVTDLEQLIQQATQLVKKRKSPEFLQKEKALIDKIKNGGPSEEVFLRQRELTQKSVNGTMTEEENKEALDLIPIFDKWTLNRLKLMIELSELWGTDLDTVMQKLNIQTPPTIYAQ